MSISYILRKQFLLVFLMLCSVVAYTQSDSLYIDSLKKVLLTEKEDTNKVNTLIVLGKHYGNDYPEAIKYLNAALKMAQAIGDIHGEASSLLEIGVIYKDIKNDYPKALYYFYKALGLYEQLPDSKQNIIRAYIAIGVVYKSQGNYSQAIKTFKTLLQLSQKWDNTYGVAWSYLEVGDVYRDQDNDDEALKSFLAALKILKETGDTMSIGKTYVKIASIYSEQGNYSSALKADSAALEMYQHFGRRGKFLIPNV